MRITNKIMENNSLYNINNNKILQDKLSTQMGTQKKLTRPSDDPVVAIRALRLRTSVSELTQFYEKNAEDADSWLDVTGKALLTVTDVLTDLSKKANGAANKKKMVDDLAIYLEQMKSLKDEFYSTGNVDYAGRYVFTGYRTDTTLTFTEAEIKETNPRYVIHEQLKMSDFDRTNYTDIGNLEGMNASNYDKSAVNELDVVNSDIHRMRLAYDSLDEAGGVKIEVIGTDKKTPVSTITADTGSLAKKPDPYQTIQEANENKVSKTVFIPETGEVLFSDKAYDDLNQKSATLSGSDTEIRISYTKKNWQEGDLRPEHYFACEGTTTKNGVDKTVSYNPEYLQGEENEQAMEYDVGYNQKIRVNTTAKEAFSHGLARDIDDLERAVNTLKEIDTTKKDLEKVMKGFDEGTADYEDAKVKYEAAVKAYDYIREKVHNMFESTLSSTKDYLDSTNIAITDNGTRSQRLSLVSNRLMDQRTTFRNLQSENENVDIAEATIQLTSAKLTYDAALMATGKIMQNSLMNYI